MPFTLAHVAAVLPLLRHPRRRWSATGLVAGSIAPDFEKFLRMGLRNSHSHTWGSIFYFGCPVALGLAFLFHLVVRDPLLNHLPQPLYRRLAGFRDFSWLAYFRRHYGRVLLSILIGGASHILWDSFTHRDGWLVHHHLPGLINRVSLGFFTVPVFSVVSFFSSCLGVGAVAATLWQLPLHPVRRVASSAAVGQFWVATAVAALAVLAGRVGLAGRVLDSWDLLISSLSAAMLGVVLVAAGYGRGGLVREHDALRER